MIHYLTYQIRIAEDGEVRLAAQCHQKERDDAPMVLVAERGYGIQGTPCCLLHALYGGADQVVNDFGRYLG